MAALLSLTNIGTGHQVLAVVRVRLFLRLHMQHPMLIRVRFDVDSALVAKPSSANDDSISSMGSSHLGGSAPNRRVDVVSLENV